MKFRKFLCVAMATFCMLGTTLPANVADVPSLSITASAAGKLSAPKKVKAAVSGSKVTISWSKVKGADAYRVYQYNASKKKYVRIKTVKGTKTTVSDLPKGKSYFKIVAVEKDGKSYIAGNSSDKITVNIKKGSASVSSGGSNAASTSNSGLTSVELAKKMGKGWNLGNTMESVANWLGSNPTPKQFEQAWGQPVTTNAMMKNLKKAGIDSVRIPVAWSNMMDSNYNISDDYFKRVDEIIGYVIDNDMYCIINIHWDGGWWEDFGSSDPKVQKAAMKKYKSMWTQIADHYKGYSDKLIFESANEELGNTTKGNSTTADSYKRVNEINQTFVDIVRNSGSNNKTRFLLIAGYNTDIDMTCNSAFKMPEDSAKDKLLVSVHYYTPSTFCIADKSNNSWGYKGSWGTSADKAAMRKDFEKMSKFTKAGYGVIIGEYGVTHCTDGGKYVQKEGTDDFFAYVVELSEEYGYCSMLWDCNDWYKRTQGKFTDEDIAKIYKQ